MANDVKSTGLQLRSTVQADGVLELALESAPVPEPKPEEVVVRVEAAPLNPSDMWLLLAGADVAAFKSTGTAERVAVAAPIPQQVMPALTARVGQGMPVGNEGAGVVVAAGSSPAAQALLGKTVSMISGGMYSEYRVLPAVQCQALPDGTTAEHGASWFINPMTALGMIETMRAEGHTALVHTAAASNLGQMLQKACLADGVKLVNIVRKPEQAQILRNIGAEYVCDSSVSSFMPDLIEALGATSATIAFDAIGGGPLAGQILTAMEVVASRKLKAYNRYGSETMKQVYLYGNLDRQPTVLNRSWGMIWGIGGWLLPVFLKKAGQDTERRLRTRVASELKTTFASHYTSRISLQQLLEPKTIAAYSKQATGEKYLLVPSTS